MDISYFKYKNGVLDYPPEDEIRSLNGMWCNKVLSSKMTRRALSAQFGYIKRWKVLDFETYKNLISTVHISNIRYCRSINENQIKSLGTTAFNYDREMAIRSFGLYPPREGAVNAVEKYKQGGPMESNLNNNNNSKITGYTDFYNISCINALYPISLTQNELVNFPIELTDKLISDINTLLKKYKEADQLRKISMVDHDLYHNNIICIIINTTYGLDKKMVDGNEIECLSCLLTGFCSLTVFDKDNDLISKLCEIISKTIRDANLKSNTALKNPEDIILSDDNIKLLTKCSNGFNIGELTIKNKEIKSLDTAYYPYIDTDILMEEFHLSEDKLLILHGNPGVGKSKLSSLMADKFNKVYNHDVIMFPGRYCMEELGWSQIESEVEDNSRRGRDTLIIIDDLDPDLFNRSAGDSEKGNIFFNSLITLLDGVISKGVKFIITTNHIIQKTEDSPLYRPGRLFDSLLLRPLTLEESLIILKKNKLSTSKIEEFKKLKEDEYYQSFVAQFISETNKRIKRSYYKGENKKVTKTKINRIGFN